MSTPLLNTIAPFVRAGFAVHLLHNRSKRPIGENWQNAPVPTLDMLRTAYSGGNNVGVRLGEPSRVDGGYLHLIDVDIRVPGLADEANEHLRELFPDVDSFPSVISGSGGESRHYYFVTEKPFRSKKLASSDGKFRRENGKWSNEWEIELFGSCKQVVLPPSIHPDTGNPYIWERPFDFDLLELGFGPTVPAERIEALAVAEQTAYEYETREPLTFKPGQLERDLDAIPISDLHYDDWIRLGQALHHQFGGSPEGFDLWLAYTKRSAKYVGEKQDRQMRRSKWRSFGKYRGKPVTMATIRQWAQDARSEAMMAELDNLDDDDFQSDNSDGEFDDILGGDGDSLDEFDAADAAAPKDLTDEWRSLLEFNEDGGVKGTLHNVELMIRNDPRIAGLPQLNEFTHEPVQRKAPGTKANRRKNSAKQTRQLIGRVWEVKDALNGDLWSETRDFAIRSILEAPKTQGGYGIKITDRDLRASIELAATDSSFHPIREYLESITWDGTPRVERLFPEYVGAPDDAYSRSVSRLMMVAAVTRIYEPGHKFDFAVILEGLQGKRKSTFIQVLGRSWFAELDGDFHDPKQMVELMQGAWIMEIPELSGFNRGDVRSIKAFISRQKDRARLAYAKRAGEFPRQCIFIGSTNDREYLKDDTGGRRFWPMLCTLDGEIDIDRLETNIDQLWAEALHMYRAMRAAQPRGLLPLYLTDPEARATAARLQESRRVESADDGWAGQIGEWLSQPINTGDIDEDEQPRFRTETCLREIWSDCFGNEPKTYNQQAAQSLGRAMGLVPDWSLCTIGSGKRRFPRYGQQRFYALGGDAGYIRRSGLPT